jgi:fumarate reductase flavoprotein subunit
VVGEDKSGESVRVNAKAVIIATGGFGDNVDMIKEYTPYEWGVDLFSMRRPGLTGDGIRMAWEVGAAKHLEAMNMELIYGSLSRGGSRSLNQPRAIMVNLNGKRFYNEGIMGNVTFMGNAIAQQKKRTGFLIIDSTIAKYYEENGADTVDRVGPPQWNLGNVDKDMTEAVEKGMKGLFVANSLEDLAKQTGIDIAGLKESIEEYNRFCEKGKDYFFNKKHEYLMPLKGPKFYAMQMFPSAYGSLGGIKINEKAEVLDMEDNPIPGLYAAGVDANSIYADSYVFILPGNTMGFAVNSGRIAGQSALKYIDK